ncbi:MAG: hypothetical protein ACRD2L_08240, partial [Terriglobia bacterium]
MVREAINEARADFEKSKEDSMPLARFRIAEKEALQLVEMRAGGKARAFLREQVENKLAELVKASAEDKTVEQIAGPVIKALTEKRAALMRREEAPMKKPLKKKEEEIEKAENDELDAAVSSEIPDTSFENVDAKLTSFLEDGDINLILKAGSGSDSDSSSSSSSSSTDSSTSGSETDSDSGSDSDSQKEDDDSSKSSKSSKSKSSSGSFDPDKVFASEAEIKKFAKELSDSPAKLESFLRNAVKRHNAAVDGQRKAERLAEAVVRRFKQATKPQVQPTDKLTARYRFVCEALAELKRRYQGLRRRFIVAESLAGLTDRKEKLEWIRTLSRAKTIREMLAGISKVKKLYGLPEADAIGAAASASDLDVKPAEKPKEED